MPGSSWAVMKPPSSGSGGKNAANSQPEDLSGNLVVQLGLATEELNRRWYQANTGHVITDIQNQIRHPALRWMAATLDGRIQGSDAVFEAKFMLPWSFSEEAAAEKYMPQLQHNMWVVAARTAVLSVITGGRQMGRDHHPCRSALPASYRHRRAQVLALRRERRAPSPRSVSSRRSHGSRRSGSSI